MPPESKNGQPTPHEYPITQAELAEYRRLDGEIRRQLSILTYRRGQICAGMGGHDVVEPGPLRPQIVYRETPNLMVEVDDTDGESVLTPVLERRLTIVEEA